MTNRTGEYYEPNMPMPARDILIRDLQFKRGIIEITGEINYEMAHSVCRQIRILDDADPEGTITLIIDSEGGNISAGMMIIDTMLAVKAPINTLCIGRAYSMAALILAAGDKRQIMIHAHTMIHSPAIPAGECGGCDIYQLNAMMRKLMDAYDQIVALLMMTTRQPQAAIEKEIKAGAVRNSRFALAFGLVDEVVGLDDPHRVHIVGTDDEGNQSAGTDEGTDNGTDAETEVGDRADEGTDEETTEGTTEETTLTA